MTTEGFETLFQYNTGYNADSVEWCPIPPYENHFVCGTYQLGEETNTECSNKQRRKGTILLFSVTKEKLEEKSCIKTSGVLDMKWCPRTINNKITLAVANADGEVCVFYLEEGYLKHVTECCLGKMDGDYLALSLDWSKIDNDLICASDSQGNITLLKFTCGNLIVLQSWNAHGLEAWITCFDSFSSDTIFTGGDDMKLNVWDLRTGKPTKVGESRKHTAGVTVLNCHPFIQYCLASGSYDEFISIWDTRNWKLPVHDMRVSGGLWRLKWSPNDKSDYLLAACIYGGFEIVKPFECFTVGLFKEHDSIAYGADWCCLSEFFDRGRYMFATCSFYDQKLCVSLWDENKSIVTG